MLNPILTHRCDVFRQTHTDSDGAPVMAWQKVASDVPCLLSIQTIRELDPLWDAHTVQRASQMARVYAEPDANILPGDHLQMTRGAFGRAHVESRGGVVPGANGVGSHRMFYTIFRDGVSV